MRLILFLLIYFNSNVAFAIDPLLSLKIGEAETKLVVLEKSLNKPGSRVDLKVLKELQDQGLFVKKIANECIDSNEEAINKSADDLELLGEQALTEDKEVTTKRQSLNQSMLSDAQQLASCRLLLLRSHEIVDVSLAKQQQALANELLAREPHIFQNFKYILLNPLQFYDASVDFIQTNSGINSIWENLYVLMALVILVLLLTILIKRGLKSSLERHSIAEQTGYLSQFQLSLISCSNRHMPPLVLFGIFSLYYAYRVFSESYWDFFGLLSFGLFLYVLTNLIIRILLNPSPPAEPLTRLPEDVSRLLARRLSLLTKLLLVGFLMYSVLQIHEFPQQITALIRNIYLFLLVLNLIWAVWLLRFYEGGSNNQLLRILITFGLSVCLLSDWMGYSNLADFILLGITGSLLAWAITIFILRMWTDFLDSLDEGRSEWQQRFRKRIGVKENEFLPGSIWFRFTFAMVIWSIFVVALLKIWGLPDTSLIILKDSVIQGFEIGTVRVVPLKVVIALLSFASMLSIIGWIKRRMDKSWLKRSRMDRGAKEAMISLTSYFGVAIAFLLGLSIAGFELANIALIAGALSVGIGFGLQNIVNNFVSGVILLFERPIKTGDWIVVGGTEGYVRKISIRSTQIQTFDRSDVIVPNSELISSQVTNLMLRDSIGRIAVPVGVAYGTEPEKVKEILLDIAYQQQAVITQSPILTKPWVLFKEFGDSSLNFELRCYIREVDDRLKVISEINYAIEKAFREAVIEIPFPQTDVHIIAAEKAPT